MKTTSLSSRQLSCHHGKLEQRKQKNKPSEYQCVEPSHADRCHNYKLHSAHNSTRLKGHLKMLYTDIRVPVKFICLERQKSKVWAFPPFLPKRTRPLCTLCLVFLRLTCNVHFPSEFAKRAACPPLHLYGLSLKIISC